MICPNCLKESKCSCPSCAERNEGKVLDVWLDKEIGVIACGHCGFAMINDAWEAMSADLYLPQMDYTGDTPVEIPGSTMLLLDAAIKYRSEGKMPGEKNYKPSFRAHWTVKLWRWRAITRSVIELVLGHGCLYRKGRRATIRDELSKY